MQKVFVYDPTASDKLSSVRGIGRYLQILKESFSNEFVFTSKIENLKFNENFKLKTENYVFVNPFFNFLQPPLTLRRIAKKQIAVIHDLIPLKYPSHFPAGIRGNINIILNKFALKNYDLIITDSEASKKDIINMLHIHKDKIKVVYPCLPLKFIKERKLKLGIETGYEDRNRKLDKSNFNFQPPNLLPNLPSNLSEIEKLLSNPKVFAVGEVGLDRHQYQKTKYKDYKVDKEFINLQKELLIEQIKLAQKYKKTLIFHNREAQLRQGFDGQAKKDILEILTSHQPLITNYQSVFHCCEPDLELLEFAKNHKMFIGVDGDVTYWDKKLYGFALSKQEFIKQVPLEMLVLETDSPFLTPKIDMKRSHHSYNEPKNIKIIAEFIAELKNVSVEKVAKITTENAKKLFNI